MNANLCKSVLSDLKIEDAVIAMKPHHLSCFSHRFLRAVLTTSGLFAALVSPAHAIAPTIMDGPHLPWAFVILVIVLLLWFKK